jgi:hypothetical protein
MSEPPTLLAAEVEAAARSVLGDADFGTAFDEGRNPEG